jgi:hypothetical protein
MLEGVCWDVRSCREEAVALDGWMDGWIEFGRIVTWRRGWV